MKAMLLAAGLGTRLRPLTGDRPKALVELNGRTLLEINLTRLRSFGVTDVIINVHHFADKVVDYLKAHNNFGLHIEISREDDLLLDTGGGLKKAAWFFLPDPGRPNSAGDDKPFLLHNVDILTNIDLTAMLRFHRQHKAVATLAVQHRKSSRLLRFDQNLELRARAEKGSLAGGDSETLAFAGVHVISPRLLPLLTETGVFSIIDSYVRLATQGQKILAFCTDQYYWRDLGRPADLTQAAADLLRGIAE
jgi:NDP-sugar pyrophosphorylase family protein